MTSPPGTPTRAAAGPAQQARKRELLVASEGEAVVHEFDRAADVPDRPSVAPRDVVLVPDFPLAELLVARGVDSAQIAVSVDPVDPSWLAAALARPAGDAVVPAVPHRFAERLLVVVPTYNEADNLERITTAIHQYVDCEILVVDDNSPDGTGAIADRLAAADARIHVLHRTQKQGLGRAYLAGFDWALERGFERVFEMDCDFSHAPWDLPRLAYASGEADLVIGSRYVPGGDTEGWNAQRRMVSRFGNFYARAWLGLPLRDMTAGFRCFRASLLERIDLSAITTSGYAFQVEMTWRAHRAGARIREVPVRFVDRHAGRSKMTKSIALEAMRKVPLLRFRG